MKEITKEELEKCSFEEQEMFALGRESVLRDFHNMCAADAFVGFTEEEWRGFKKMITLNEKIAGLNFN